MSSENLLVFSNLLKCSLSNCVGISRWKYEPESSHQPIHRFHCRAELQSSSDESQKGFNDSIQLLILCSIHLCPVFGFTLLAEDCTSKLLKATVQGAELPEPFITNIIDSVKVLRSGDFALEDQGMRMRDTLRFQVELVGRLGRDLRQLRGEGRGHCEMMNEDRSQAKCPWPIALFISYTDSLCLSVIPS